MLELLHDYYHLDNITLYQITHKVYKVESKQGIYCIKIVDNKHLEKMLYYIETLSLNNFVEVIKNKENLYLTSYKDKYIYMMEYLEIDKLDHEMKLKYYDVNLIDLHQKTFYDLKVDKEKRNEIYKDIENKIHQRINEYNTLMKEFEYKHYKSPSGWMVLLNYYKINQTIQRSYHYLQLLKDYNYDYIRSCIVYKNYHDSHICISSHKFISIDYIDISMCIDDMIDIYQSLKLDYKDYCLLIDEYIKEVELRKEEKLFFACMLCMIPVLKYQNTENKNIESMNRILSYLRGIDDIIKKLKIDE